jgi:hypothetical protein
MNLVAMLVMRAAVYRDLQRDKPGSVEGPSEVYRESEHRG